MIVFTATHLATLALILLAAAAAGSLVLRRDEGLALRCALGLALLAHAAFFLGLLGLLKPLPIVVLLLALFAFARIRRGPVSIAIATGALLFIPALYPPFAFDETLYHLPYVREFAKAGALQVLPYVRFPVFPVLQELLAVPPWLLLGDTGPHLIAVAETMILAALLVEWSGTNVRAGWIAAALFLGSPLIVHLGSVLYVDIALALFVAAGFYALDRDRNALAGFFFGTACSVKYLGGFFAAAALLIAIVRSRRKIAPFIATAVAAALPMTTWIWLKSGDILFPFLVKTVWTPPPAAPPDHFARAATLLWDVTFARDRAGLQPPVTPFLIGMALLLAVAARRDLRARFVLLLSIAFIAVFITFLPPDSRYLVSLLPLISIVVAPMLASRRAAAWIAMIAIAPGIAYAVYRVAHYGVPPATVERQHRWLERRVPEYRALQQAGTARVYTCGGEQLKSYAAGQFLGDHLGPYSYERVLGGVQPLDFDYLLVAKRTCRMPIATAGMELVYEDASAQLWKVASFSPPPRLSR